MEISNENFRHGMIMGTSNRFFNIASDRLPSKTDISSVLLPLSFRFVSEGSKQADLNLENQENVT